MSRKLLPIEMLALDVKALGAGRVPLNALAAQGYAPLVGTYVPPPHGGKNGMIVYILGDVSQVGPEAEEPETEAEEPDADTEAEGLAAVGDGAPEVLADAQHSLPGLGSNGNGNGTHPPESHDATTEGA